MILTQHRVYLDGLLSLMETCFRKLTYRASIQNHAARHLVITHQHQHLDHHHQHELQGLSTPRDQRVWQSTTGGHHHGDLPVPRFASIMPAAPSPHSATAMLQVPIFSSLSEALHHQREQQKRQAQAGQLQNDLSLHHLPHPANSLIHAQPSMGGGVCISNASCSTPRQMSDSAGAAHAMPNGQQPPRQGQRHRACGPLATVEQSHRNEQQQQQRDRGVGGGSFGSAGNGYGVDELCSPGGLVASQVGPSIRDNYFSLLSCRWCR